MNASSQEPAIGSYADSGVSSPNLPTQFHQDPF
jgi:hypothetical protein